MKTRSSRRHDSLIPLSRQHHYALMLCLRINGDLPEHSRDESWLRTKREQVSQFFAGDLWRHFKVEEEILFPAMQEFADAAQLLDELLMEHRQLEALVIRLQSEAGDVLAAALKTFAELLESHVRKEERLLFPIYEQQVSTWLARRIEGEIIGRIGSAVRPQSPELLM